MPVEMMDIRFINKRKSMPRITNIEVVNKNDQPIIFIRTTTRMQDLPKVIGPGYQKLADYLKEMGEYIGGVPFVAFHNMDMENLDIEMCFPVTHPMKPKGEIQPGVIPAGLFLTTTYLGPYQEAMPVYEEMAKWLEERGFRLAGPHYEHYCNDPGEVDEKHLLTLISWPIEVVD